MRDGERSKKVERKVERLREREERGKVLCEENCVLENSRLSKKRKDLPVL